MCIRDSIGPDWITDLSQISKLKVYADDEKALQEFMNIKFQNKQRLAKYILEHNGVEVDPHSIFDVQVKRLHEYKRQLLNILHVIYLYNQIKLHPEMEFYPRTFIFGAKASAAYEDVYKRQSQQQSTDNFKGGKSFVPESRHESEFRRSREKSRRILERKPYFRKKYGKP